MPNRISQIVIPIKNSSTGITENQTFNLRDSSSPEENGFGYGICITESEELEKIVDLTSFVLTKNAIVSIYFEEAVSAGSTLNINDTGDKDICHRGSGLGDNVILDGDTATFIYDGICYNLIAIDRTAKVVNKTLII
jgi:hypothetical protein